MKTLPDNAKARYHYPIVGGCLAYFPAALAGVAKHSYIGGAKYNNGALKHLRYVSTQHFDCVGRHVLDIQDLMAARERGVAQVEAYVWNFNRQVEELISIPIEEAIAIEANALAWRSLAISQEIHEKLLGAPVAPAAVLEPEPIQPVRLTDIGNDKVAVVKMIRTLTGAGLKEALSLAQNLPSTINYGDKWDRNEVVRLLRGVGATVT